MTQNLSANQLELVDFRVFEAREDGTIYEGIYGINVSKVREIIVLPPLTRVPDAHPVIEGLFNLRGVQLPAVNLARWLRVQEAPPAGVSRKAIVAEFSRHTLGLIIHQAQRIRRVAWDHVKPPPPLVQQQHGNSIVGTTTVDDDRTLLLLDVERVVADLEGPADALAAAAAPAAVAPTGPGRVLVVDDSAVARRRLAQVLTQAGYAVVEAADGAAGLERLHAEAGRGTPGDAIRLVITDVEMPRLDGYTFTARLKADEALRHLPVIMHSSLGGEANLRRGQQSGCDDYLVKFEPATLLAMVARHWSATPG